MTFWNRRRPEPPVEKFVPIPIPVTTHPVTAVERPAPAAQPEPDRSDAELSFIIARGDLDSMSSQLEAAHEDEEVGLIDIRHSDVIDRAVVQLIEKENKLIARIEKDLDSLRRTQLTREGYEKAFEHIRDHAADDFADTSEQQKNFNTVKTRTPKVKQPKAPEPKPEPLEHMDLSQEMEA